MKQRLFVSFALLSVLALLACRKESTARSVISGPPEAGASYSLSDNEGGFRVAKVVAVEEEVVFVSLYGNRWITRPGLVETRHVSNAVPLAFSMVTFSGMQPVHLENGAVSPEEEEQFQDWRKGKREVF